LHLYLQQGKRSSFFHIYRFDIFFNTKDSIPALPKPPDTKKASNLLKKIADFFKFKKKSSKNITNIADQLVKDSIAATKKNFSTLLDSLSNSENKKYSYLLSIINKIKDEGENQVDAITVTSTAKKPEKGSEDLNANVVTDNDVKELANKMYPYIDQKVKEDSIKNTIKKNEKLAQIKKIADEKKKVLFIA